MPIQSMHAHFGNRHTAAEPRFGFVGSAVNVMSNIAQQIDSNKITELVVTDVGGMVLPRTGIELAQRGPDAGREAFFREIMGTIFNVFMVGWVGLLNYKLFNHFALTAGVLNPLGLNVANNQRMLDQFNQRFLNAVQAGKPTAQELRHHLITDVIESLTPTDGYLIKGNKALESLYDPANVRQAKDRMIELIMNPEAHAVPFADRNIHQRAWAIVQDVERGAQQGDPLSKSLLHRFGESAEGIEKARRQLYQSEVLKLSRPAAEQEKFLIQRLVELAREANLFGEIRLKAPEGAADYVSQAENIFRELLHFDREYVLRALTDTQTGRLFTENLATDEMKTRLMKRMNGQGIPFKGLERLKALIPNEADSLMKYSRKSKFFLLFIPIIGTAVMSISIAFLNNWLTRRLHGGEVFFPGEGVPAPGKTAGANPAAAEPSAPAALSLQSSAVFSTLARPDNIYAVFQQPRAASRLGSGQGVSA